MMARDTRNTADGNDLGDATRRTSGIRVLDNDRPRIVVSPRIDQVVTAATRALARDADTYQRGGALAHVVRIDADDRRTHLPGGTPTIRLISRAILRARLARCARWVRLSRDDGGSTGSIREKETRPDAHALDAVLDAGEWPGVHVLSGVTETPIVRRDGSIVQRPGYDRATGYVYVPSCEYPTVAEQPSQEDARRALDELVNVWRDFPFARDVERYVAIAALLTVLARPAIDGAVPLVVIDKSTRGSGATLASDVIAAIATGRCAARTTYSEDDAETRKVLDGHALGGSRLLVLDNVTTPLGGAALDAYVTARDTVDVRVLGRTGQIATPWRGIVIATGNNLEYRSDTIRRVLACRLEPRDERPEDRTGFEQSDLVGYVLTERARLVTAALTIVRAFFVAGRREAGSAAWGGFEAWSRLIPPAIVHAGGPDVLGARVGAEAGVDRDADAVRTLMDAIARLDSKGRGVASRDMIRVLYPDGRAPRDDAAPDGYDEARAAIESLCPPRRAGEAPTPTRLGQALSRARGRWIRGRRLVPVPGHGGAMRWRIEAASTSTEAQP
jgi:hypothetical protein